MYGLIKFIKVFNNFLLYICSSPNFLYVLPISNYFKTFHFSSIFFLVSSLQDFFPKLLFKLNID